MCIPPCPPETWYRPPGLSPYKQRQKSWIIHFRNRIICSLVHSFIHSFILQVSIGHLLCAKPSTVWAGTSALIELSVHEDDGHRTSDHTDNYLTTSWLLIQRPGEHEAILLHVCSPPAERSQQYRAALRLVMSYSQQEGHDPFLSL